MQFVQFNQFRSNPARLAKVTLTEISLQFAQHFKTKGIKPSMVLERIDTEQLISASWRGAMGDDVRSSFSVQV